MKTLTKILTVSLASLVLAGCTAYNSKYFYGYDRGDCHPNRFDTVNSDLDIDLEWKNDSLYLRWDQYEGEDFAGYYLIRDDNDNCPYYYINGDYLDYGGGKFNNYYKDKDLQSGDEYYYRVCVKTNDKDIECGSVMQVEIY